jgi:hypothetical protein
VATATPAGFTVEPSEKPGPILAVEVGGVVRGGGVAITGAGVETGGFGAGDRTGAVPVTLAGFITMVWRDGAGVRTDGETDGDT